MHVLLEPDDVPVAFTNVCLHFGGTLACEGGEFRCEWHGATFDRLTGGRTGGPAPEDSRLMRLPTVVKDGVLTYARGETTQHRLAPPKPC